MSVQQLVENERIRQSLLMSPDARRCEIGNCQVITQGGNDGLVKHQRKIHFTDEWLRGDDGA